MAHLCSAPLALLLWLGSTGPAWAAPPWPQSMGKAATFGDQESVAYRKMQEVFRHARTELIGTSFASLFENPDFGPEKACALLETRRAILACYAEGKRHLASVDLYRVKGRCTVGDWEEEMDRVLDETFLPSSTSADHWRKKLHRIEARYPAKPSHHGCATGWYERREKALRRLRNETVAMDAERFRTRARSAQKAALSRVLENLNKAGEPVVEVSK